MYWHWQPQLFLPILIIKTIIIIAVLVPQGQCRLLFLPVYFFSPWLSLVFSLSRFILLAFFLVFFIFLFQDGWINEAGETSIIPHIFSGHCLVLVSRSLPARRFRIILYLKYLST